MSEETKAVETTQPTETQEQKPEQTSETKQQESKPLDYEALYSQDKAMQSYVDKRITEATKTAVANALQKQQRAHDESLTRAERLQAMSDADKVKFLEEENRKLQDKYTRDKEIESLRTQTAGMLNESKIPAVFLDIFNFESATAEDIKRRVTMLAEYEYHAKGEFERQLSAGITAGINEKLKQNTPETHAVNQDANDLFLQGFNSNYGKLDFFAKSNKKE